MYGIVNFKAKTSTLNLSNNQVMNQLNLVTDKNKQLARAKQAAEARARKRSEKMRLRRSLKSRGTLKKAKEITNKIEKEAAIVSNVEKAIDGGSSDTYDEQIEKSNGSDSEKSSMLIPVLGGASALAFLFLATRKKRK